MRPHSGPLKQFTCNWTCVVQLANRTQVVMELKFPDSHLLYRSLTLMLLTKKQSTNHQTGGLSAGTPYVTVTCRYIPFCLPSNSHFGLGLWASTVNSEVCSALLFLHSPPPGQVRPHLPSIQPVPLLVCLIALPGRALHYQPDWQPVRNTTHSSMKIKYIPQLGQVLLLYVYLKIPHKHKNKLIIFFFFRFKHPCMFKHTYIK